MPRPVPLAILVLVVATVTERGRQPPPSGLIPLTCNEIQRLFAAWSPDRPAISATGCAGQHGDADIRYAPVAATTDESRWAI